MKRVIFASMMLLALAGTPAAGAAPEGRGWSGHDIKIADAEAKATQMFDKVDSDHDGVVSHAEFDAAPRPRFPMHHMGLGMAMAKLAPHNPHGPMSGPDGDHVRPDPTVELPALFKRLDTNHDGHLTNGEFAKLPDAHRAQMQEHIYAMLDADHNGSLSRAEFPPLVAHLKALDKNSDGVVTTDELPRRGKRHGMNRDDEDGDGPDPGTAP